MLLDCRPPTAATGVATMTLLPPAVTALLALELVMMPQPMLTDALPCMITPTAVVDSSDTTQYSPLVTAAAVASTVITGGELNKKLENGSTLLVYRTTRTASVSPA